MYGKTGIPLCKDFQNPLGKYLSHEKFPGFTSDGYNNTKKKKRQNTKVI